MFSVSFYHSVGLLGLGGTKMSRCSRISSLSITTVCTTNEAVLVSRARASQQCYGGSHSAVFRPAKHFGIESATNQPASSSALCPRCMTASL